MLQSAGNLGTTQGSARPSGRATCEDPNAPSSLATVDRLFEAALYVGSLGVEVAASHRHTLGDAGTATFILGGQIADQDPDILLVYPEGNYVRASEDRPFLQIGETKYGKSLLDLAVRAHADLVQAAKIALSSMTSTAMANLSVGPPYDLGMYRNDSFNWIMCASPASHPISHDWRRSGRRICSPLSPPFPRWNPGTSPSSQMSCPEPEAAAGVPGDTESPR